MALEYQGFSESQAAIGSIRPPRRSVLPDVASLAALQQQYRAAHDVTHELKRRAPIFSAHKRMTRWQIAMAVVAVEAIAALFVFLSLDAAIQVLCEIFSVIFLATVWVRVLALFEHQPLAPSPVVLPDYQLPTYSVLVPLHNEAAMLPQLVRALSEMNYPQEKLDIKLLLEEKDVATRLAAQRLMLPFFIEIQVVPSGAPQTKPRALNYGLHFARGQLLTIFDAEDIPSPMQLRRAAQAFASLPRDVACLQAELAFHNANENWLARQFAIEYAVQFRMILPALARHRMPLPLGGTSNHFRTDVLRDICGWDPYNVTEDADIGLRLARLGFRTSVLKSVTLEEANIEFSNWLAQRARWLKGFLQTWLVHMRKPSRLRRELGFMGFLSVQSMLFGVTLSALLHPFFLGLMIWQVGRGTFINTALPSPWLELNYFYVGSLILSYGVMMGCGLMASRGMKLKRRFLTIVTMPGYWLLTSIAGWMALWQFIRHPYHWNKTRHGLSRMRTMPSGLAPLVRAPNLT